MASVSINFMREKVAELYPSETWKQRVLRLMSDRQVMAIYHYALEHNKFDKKNNGEYHQMNIFEFMANN